MFDTISVIGLGYIGLPTAALFASREKKVIGVDVVEEVVNAINCGKIMNVEPGLDSLVESTVRGGYLCATSTPECADAFLIAVPTPFKEDHKVNLSFIKAASLSMAPVLNAGNLVILESTSPVGTTTQELAAWLAEARPDLTFPQHAGDAADIQIAYCPERVLPGKILTELVSNDRVIGGMSPTASAMAVELYKIFVQGECVVTNAPTAEMCKLTENCFRDVNIAFANEISILSDTFGINVWELISLANRHPRVNILQPGPGVGGHCIAVDPWFLVESCPRDARLIRKAREVNEFKSTWMLEKIKAAITDAMVSQPNLLHITDVKIACLGLAFKPNIDDLRESPALAIARAASSLGCTVLAVEPNIAHLPAAAPPSMLLCTLQTALNDADIVCVLVKHQEFVDARESIARHKHVIDAVGLRCG